MGAAWASTSASVRNAAVSNAVFFAVVGTITLQTYISLRGLLSSDCLKNCDQTRVKSAKNVMSMQGWVALLSLVLSLITAAFALWVTRNISMDQ